MNNNKSVSPTKHPAWHKLKKLAKQPWCLNQLFEDSDRAKQFVTYQQGIYFDYAKQCINKDVINALIELAQQCQLSDKIAAMFNGERVNGSEDRAALHTALRSPCNIPLWVNGENLNSKVHDSLQKAEQLVERIRSGVWRGFSGKAITNVVNIGVGGSDLGPLMASAALAEWADSNIRVHFVSNMDGTQLGSLLTKLNPETTLFIISSKSFGTVDTLSNAQTALAWLLARFDNRQTILRRHFIGISANLDKVRAWGIAPEHQLCLWDWVGGRFSMWSAIGLAIAIRIGMPQFYEMLAGAHAMDRHFRQAEFNKNLPVLLGLIGVWNSSFLDIHAHTVLPYDGRLQYLPSYLTQLEMESNGKSVTQAGDVVTYSTSPILWGEIGSNAQHAFYQLLHQGTQRVSCDFIACVRYYQNDDNNYALQHQHQLSLANCLAQSRVLAFGNQAVTNSATDLAQNKPKNMQFKRYRGNQPSTTMLLDELTPKSFGQLIALYEHKVYVMASIWGINPFDQWGVEMGKQVADKVYKTLAEKNNSLWLFDASTDALLTHIKQSN